MAKKKVNKIAPADFVTSMCQNAQAKAGAEKVYVASEHEKREWGLPIPWLALQWLLHSNVFLLQKVWGAAGLPHSCKSAFLFELFRIHAMYGGVGALIETEGKFSHELFKAILWDLEDNIMYQRAETVDEVQCAATNVLKFIKNSSKTKEQIVMLGIDSLTGTLGEEMKKKIGEEGHADRAFPETALKYAPYFQYLTGELVGWPITAAFTNHRKKDVDGGADRTPGGSSQNFHASIYLWMDKLGQDRPKADGTEGRMIRFRTKKNSFGPNDRRIACEFKWWWDVDPETGLRYQRAIWDWDAATAHMLSQKLIKTGMPTKVGDIINVKADGLKYSCKLLGLKDVTAHEMGVAIHNDPELMRELGDALAIHQYESYGGVQAIQSVLDEEAAKRANAENVEGVVDYVPEEGESVDV